MTSLCQVYIYFPVTSTTVFIMSSNVPVDNVEVTGTSYDIISFDPGSFEKHYGYNKDYKGQDQYLYYISKGDVIKVDKNNPDNKQTFSLPGASHIFIDAKRHTLYYVLYRSEIIKEDLLGKSKPEIIVWGIEQVGSVSYDPVKEKIYFTDSSLGTIESYDIKTRRRKVHYSGLINPRKLSADGPLG